MANVKSGIGLLGVVVVVLANVATPWAQADELHGRQRERINRTPFDEGFPSAAAGFGTEVKITASDDTAGRGAFGGSVAISGNTAIVGAELTDHNGENTGAAYIYQRNEGGVGNWGQVVKLTASDAEVGDQFGRSVAISGDTAIVGAKYDDDNAPDSGSAYVFQRNRGGVDNWGLVAKITASDGAAESWFGLALAISGNTAIVGAMHDDENGEHSGSAYVYQRNRGGIDNWGQVTKITASDAAADDVFGYSIAITGDTAIVGAVWWADDRNGEHAGAAYVFQRDEGGADNWGEVIQITASDGAAKGRFGWSVAISGTTAIVGAAGNDGNAENSGSAYVYQRNKGGVDNWGEVTKITSSDGAAGDFFGRSVAISGDTAIVGATDNDDDTGAAYVYRRDEGGVDNWGELIKVSASDGEYNARFGGSVAISDDIVIGGARQADDFEGAAYVYFSGCSSDAECADGLFCNGDEVCVTGRCQFANAPCQGGPCSEADDTCSCDANSACDDGNRCNGNEICNTQTGECLPGTPMDCDDGNECNGLESCDLETGDCVDGEFDDCDGNGTDDACDLADCGGEVACADCDGNGSLDRCDISGGQPDVNGNGVLDQCEPCTDNASCDDSELCSFDRCIDNVCSYDVDARYGDVAGEEGVCGPDGDVNLSDIIAVLDAFSGQFAEGCELVNVDIAGDAGSCVPNGTINLNDILAVLDAFQGLGDCCAGRR